MLLQFAFLGSIYDLDNGHSFTNLFAKFSFIFCCINEPSGLAKLNILIVELMYTEAPLFFFFLLMAFSTRNPSNCCKRSFLIFCSRVYILLCSW